MLSLQPTPASGETLTDRLASPCFASRDEVAPAQCSALVKHQTRSYVMRWITRSTPIPVQTTTCPPVTTSEVETSLLSNIGRDGDKDTNANAGAYSGTGPLHIHAPGRIKDRGVGPSISHIYLAVLTFPTDGFSSTCPMYFAAASTQRR